MLKFKFNINGVEITVTGDNEKEVMKRAELFFDLPTVCPVEGCGHDLVFFHRSPQGNDYYGLKCTNSEPHETNFGIPKEEGRSLYYKGQWHKSFKGDEENGTPKHPGSGEPKDLYKKIEILFNEVKFYVSVDWQNWIIAALSNKDVPEKDLMRCYDKLLKIQKQYATDELPF